MMLVLFLFPLIVGDSADKAPGVLLVMGEGKVLGWSNVLCCRGRHVDSYSLTPVSCVKEQLGTCIKEF